MKAVDVKCRLCGQNAWQASERGAYLARVNQKGVAPISECRPSCDRVHGNQNDALINALEGK